MFHGVIQKKIKGCSFWNIVCTRAPLTSAKTWLCRRPNSPLSAAKHFRLPILPSGTDFRKRRQCINSTYHFSITWKPFCSDAHSRTLYYSGSSCSNDDYLRHFKKKFWLIDWKQLIPQKFYTLSLSCSGKNSVKYSWMRIAIRICAKINRFIDNYWIILLTDKQTKAKILPRWRQ